MADTFSVDCPRDDCEGVITFCEGVITFFEDESETWRSTFLVMDEHTCDAGHQFSPEEVTKLEADATEAWKEGVITDPD